MAATTFTSLQEEAEHFLMHLGNCITEWARVEDQLFKLCRDILGTATEHTAIIYYRTPSIDTRLSLADELIGTIFPAPESGKHRHKDYKIWEKINADIKAHLPTRNRLAHSPVGPNLITTDGKRDIRFQSLQHPNERARKKGDKPAITLEDLKRHAIAVTVIDTNLGDFRHGLLPAHIAKLFPQNIGLLTGQY